MFNVKEKTNKIDRVEKLYTEQLFLQRAMLNLVEAMKQDSNMISDLWYCEQLETLQYRHNKIDEEIKSLLL